MVLMHCHLFGSKVVGSILAEINDVILCYVNTLTVTRIYGVVTFLTSDQIKD